MSCQKVLRAAKRNTVYPYELAAILGDFTEYDLDAEQRLVPVDRAKGRNSAAIVAGVVVVYGVLWFGAYNVALNAGETYLDAGTAALVVNIGPILIALLAGIVLKEGFPRPLVVGMAIAFAGVVLIATSTRHDTAVETASATGVLLCVAAAVLYAVGALTQKPTA